MIVKVGDHYFHVDTTWDDDGDDIIYDWFMKSDSQIKGKPSHMEWKLSKPSALHNFQKDSLPVCNSIIGDVNENGIIDAVDASAILSSYARLAVGEDDDIDTVLADCNFDGKINAADASKVITEYAEASVEKEAND